MNTFVVSFMAYVPIQCSRTHTKLQISLDCGTSSFAWLFFHRLNKNLLTLKKKKTDAVATSLCALASTLQTNSMRPMPKAAAALAYRDVCPSMAAKIPGSGES